MTFHTFIPPALSAVLLALGAALAGGAPGPVQAQQSGAFQQAGFGYTGPGCSVSFGPELVVADLAAMEQEALRGGAYGFVIDVQTNIGKLITAPFPAACRPPADPPNELFLATGPVFDYVAMDFGFNGCPVQWGPLLTDTDLDAMEEAAHLAGAVGFAYNPSLGYGSVLVGAYPQHCQSDPSLSWPLYLARGAMAQYPEQSFGYSGCDVNWGPLIRNTNLTAMIVAAEQAGASGFTFQDSLGFGYVMVGSYPSGCRSSPTLSWPLFLKQ